MTRWKWLRHNDIFYVISIYFYHPHTEWASAQKKASKNNIVSIFDIPVNNLTMSETLSVVTNSIARKTQIHHTVINVGKVVSMQKDQRLKESVVNADLINADGAGIILASKLFGTPLKERVTGIDLMEKLVEVAHENNYVETILGRRLQLPNIKSRNGMLKKAAERAAINAPMQGTAADIIKKAMIDMAVWVAEQPAGTVQILMQVHDELVFSIKDECVEAYTLEIQKIMANAADLDVPLIADAGVGENWDEAH